MAQGGKFEQGLMARSVAGGTAEEIGGGKFANGAVTGVFTVM